MRLENGYTQKRVADFLNVKQNTYSQYENGLREPPLLSLVKIAELYATSVDYLLGITEYEEPYPRR